MNRLNAIADRLAAGRAPGLAGVITGKLASLRIAEDSLCTGVFTHWLYRGDNILHVLAAAHQLPGIRRISDRATLVNEQGNRRQAAPLHYAADAIVDGEHYREDNQEGTILRLIELGAEVDAADKNGATPLLRAVRCRSYIAVKTLLDQGADPAIANLHGSGAMKLIAVNSGRGCSGMTKAKDNQQRIVELLKGRG